MIQKGGTLPKSFSLSELHVFVRQLSFIHRTPQPAIAQARNKLVIQFCGTQGDDKVMLTGISVLRKFILAITNS